MFSKSFIFSRFNRIYYSGRGKLFGICYCENIMKFNTLSFNIIDYSPVFRIQYVAKGKSTKKSFKLLFQLNTASNSTFFVLIFMYLSISTNPSL